jgi:hypothetical protein
MEEVGFCEMFWYQYRGILMLLLLVDVERFEEIVAVVLVNNDAAVLLFNGVFVLLSAVG